MNLSVWRFKVKAFVFIVGCVIPLMTYGEEEQ
jgi:hypothetical protein